MDLIQFNSNSDHLVLGARKNICKEMKVLVLTEEAKRKRNIKEKKNVVQH